MTTAIDKAIQTRWTAKSLDDTVTGGLFHGRSTELTAMPYASYSNVGGTKTIGTRTGRYMMKTVQIQVWDTTDILVGSHIEAIKNAFVHSDRAATSPLVSPATDEIITDVELAAEPTVIEESDDVWQGLIQLDISYVEDRNLTPA